MLRRILLGALAGGLAIFVGGFVVHVILPLGEAGIRPLPNEFAAIEQLQKIVPGPGVYIYPGMESVNQKDEAATKAYEEKTRNTPHGIVVMAAPFGSLMPPEKLGFQFLGDLAAALVAAVLLAWAPIPSYLTRAVFVALLALFGGFLISIPQWNWYGFSAAFIVPNMLAEVLRGLSGGLAIAAIVKPGAK